MKIIVPGQYPRSERLIAATRDIERKRISQSDLEKVHEDEFKEFKKQQHGATFYSTGLFNMQDLLRPVTQSMDGAKEGTLTRFFETNTFWKLLDADANATINDGKLQKVVDEFYFAKGLYAKDEPLLFTLPFLYLFQTYSSGLTLEKISAILEKVATKLLSYPNKALCFFEPNIGWRKFTEKEKAAGRKLIENIKSHTKAPVYIYSAFYQITQEKEFMYSLPTDGYGIDFYANSIVESMRGFPAQKTLLAGIMHTENTRIETPNMVQDFFKMLGSHIPKEQVIVTPSGPAELLPRVIMDKKITNMKSILQCLKTT